MHVKDKIYSDFSPKRIHLQLKKSKMYFCTSAFEHMTLSINLTRL